jgi:hypothetical protein
MCVFVETLLSIRLPDSVCFVFMQAMILPMHIFKKLQSTFGIITQRRKILGVTSLCGVTHLNALISSPYSWGSSSVKTGNEWDTNVTSTVLLKIMMRLSAH